MTSSWFEGEQEEIEAGDDLASTFWRAESLYWRGEAEAAFDLYARVLRTAPSGLHARFAAARLYEMHGEVVEWGERAASVVDPITFGQVHPITASYLSLIGQRLVWDTWQEEQTPRPFSADETGLAVRWRTTPVLSPLRLSDFDTPFAPESEKVLAHSYRSPVWADDDASNIARTTSFSSTSINLSPQLGSEGIHYMETFATVEATSPQVYWIVASFSGAARLFIDGVEVIERREGSYGTGKRWRRVELAPGSHRILLKLAYQPRLSKLVRSRLSQRRGERALRLSALFFAAHGGA